MFNKSNISYKFLDVPILFLLAVIGVYLRLHGAEAFDYNNDEIMHLDIANASSLKQVLQFSFYEVHPPVFYILLHFWLKLSENIEFARSMSLLFGIALIPIFYFIGKELNNRITGLCAAIFITFSYACILNSFLLRQYMLMIFFLSAGFYFYILWRKNTKEHTLLTYLVLSDIACLTHFSAIFFVFTLALYQLVSMARTSPVRLQLQWVAANICVGILWASVLYAWKDSITLARTYCTPYYPLHARLADTRIYLRTALDYILPAGKYSLCVLIAFTAIAITSKQDVNRSRLIGLVSLALVVAVLLVWSGFYPSDVGRHAVWLLPFIVLMAAWVCADTFEFFGRLLTKYITFLPRIEVALCMVLIAMVWFSYSPVARFADGEEYQFQKKNIKDLKEYFSSLGSTTLIVAERDEVFLMKDIYPYLSDDPFNKSNMATLVPYQHSYILFNPYFRRIRSKDALLQTIQAAKSKGFLKDVTTLVFMHSAPVVDLIKCPALDKKVLWFSERHLTNPYNLSDAFDVNIPVLVVQKQQFLEQVLSPIGEARKCLRDDQAQIN